jgi:predicted enzyme related to lactoylglutathione lyase
VAAHIRLGAIAVDCGDPARLAEFYRALTGWDIGFSNEAFAALRGKDGGVYLTMHRVADHRPPDWPGPGTAPKQMHLDFAVSDLESSQARAIEAGAVLAGHQPDPDRFRVLLDPAGHPFCLSLNFPAE